MHPSTLPHGQLHFHFHIQHTQRVVAFGFGTAATDDVRTDACHNFLQLPKQLRHHISLPVHLSHHAQYFILGHHSFGTLIPQFPFCLFQRFHQAGAIVVVRIVFGLFFMQQHVPFVLGTFQIDF